MRCSYCGAELKAGSKFCGECGAPVSDQSRQRAAELAEGGVMLLGSAARERRLLADYSEDTIVSPRMYNLVLVATVLWGLVVNVILCVSVGDVYRYINPLLFLVLYFVVAFLGIKIAAKSNDPKISFLGYNMIVVPFGLVISSAVEMYGGIDSAIVTYAFVYTLLIVVGMLAVVMIVPESFSRLGGALLACLTGVIICELVLLLFGVRQNITDWIVAAIFSLYIGYDIYRSQRFAMTVDNAVDCALDIYMDIANLFLRLLRIMSRSKKNN